MTRHTRRTLIVAMLVSVWATSAFSAGRKDSIYCDEQSTQKEAEYCWARGGDPRPGGRVDRCIEALPEGMQYFQKVERCVGTKNKRAR